MKNLIAAVGVLSLAAQRVSVAHAECPTIFPLVDESFFLDTFEFQGVATSAAALASGAPHEVTLDGTSSIFGPSTWSSFPLCAGSVPENAPRYPSLSGPGTGKVGMDPHYFFASQVIGGVCVGGLPLPSHAGGVQLCLSGDCPANPAVAGGWSHPGGGTETYRPDHVYEHRVDGQGFPIAVRRPDNPYNDNYGRFRITVRSLSSAEMAQDIIDSTVALDPSAFRNANQQAAFLEKLNVVLASLAEGRACDGALHKLCSDILPKTDGESRPSDWVVDPEAQQDLEDLIERLASALGGCP
jgi:hypothetical protein